MVTDKPQGYSHSAVAYWLDGKKRWPLKRQRRAQREAAMHALNWWSSYGTRMFEDQEDGDKRGACYCACKAHVEREMRPKGFIFGFLFWAVIQAVIGFVVFQVLNWIFHDEAFRKTFK